MGHSWTEDVLMILQTTGIYMYVCVSDMIEEGNVGVRLQGLTDWMLYVEERV